MEILGFGIFFMVLVAGGVVMERYTRRAGTDRGRRLGAWVALVGAIVLIVIFVVDWKTS